MNVVGTVANSFNLTDVLAILQLNSIADTVAELLPFLGDRNNAGFVTAVLVDLGLVKIIWYEFVSGLQITKKGLLSISPSNSWV